MSETGHSPRSLRAHDVHLGLQAAEIDRTSGLVGEELEAAQLVGMAAALATAIKGLDYIEDAPELKRVANQQYDIPTFAFERVIKLLSDVDYVRRVQNSGSKVKNFYENVPEDFTRLYDTLDEAYEDQDPSEVDRGVLDAVDTLSFGPRAVEDLEVEPELRGRVLTLASAAEAIQVVDVDGVDVAYSPFFAYENPQKIGELLRTVDLSAVRSSYEQVRRYQGFPITDEDDGKVLEGLVGAGLMAGPHLEDPSGNIKIFALAPYGLPEQLLTVEKTVLDKAMAIVAAMRMGQHWGGATPIHWPIAILNKLLQPGAWVARHSSTARQYSTLYQLGIVRFDDWAVRKAIQLIDTHDNRRAVEIAKDLLQHGEAMSMKEQPAGELYIPDRGNYRTPVQTIRPARRRTAGANKGHHRGDRAGDGVDAECLSSTLIKSSTCGVHSGRWARVRV